MAADLDGAITRVRRWLRGTVPGDLARVVGTGDGVATDDVAAVLDALDAAQRSAATERAQREAAEGECARLRADAAVTLRAEREAATEEAAAQRDVDDDPSDDNVAAYEEAAYAAAEARAKTDAALAGAPVEASVSAGQLVANALHWLDATFYENARGTGIDPEVRDDNVKEYLDHWRDALAVPWVRAAADARVARDAAVAQREALAGAVRREREAEAYHREAVAECERCLSKPRAWWDRAKLEEERAAASLEDARRTLRAALDALLTEGTRSVADEAECDDCGDDMASGYFDPMARCPRHRP